MERDTAAIPRSGRGWPSSRAMMAATMRRARGAANGNSRLNDDAARAIRHAWAAGERNKAQLARRHRVGWDAVHKIIRDETWKHAGDVSFVEGLDG